MSPTPAQERSLVDWGVAARPAPDQQVCGDLHVVKPFDHGILLGAIDGVGHGREAVAAAQAAAAVLDAHACEPLISLVQRCHGALTQTRGVAITLASVDATLNTLTWLGVGNVEGLLLRAEAASSRRSERVLLHGGLVGFHLPALQTRALKLAGGDLLVFATDGIRSDFTVETRPKDSPADLAARVLRGHFKGTDDGLVLAARYLGTPHE